MAAGTIKFRLDWGLAVLSLALALVSSAGFIPIWGQIQQGLQHMESIRLGKPKEEIPPFPDPEELGFIPFGMLLAGLGGLVTGGTVYVRAGDDARAARNAGITGMALNVAVLVALLFITPGVYGSFGVSVWW